MKKFFQFKNEAGSEEPAELAIYDVVGFYGATAKDFYNQLKSIGNKALNVRINSPGGSVVDGYAIYNLLYAHKATVTVFIDGVAASIASVIAMAGDKVIMPKNSLMLIHNPSVFIDGDAETLRKVADDMDKIKSGIVSAYRERTGKTEAKISKMMDEETLLTAEEAVEMGFADEVASPVNITNQFKDHLRSEVVAKLSTAEAPASGGSQETNSKTTNEMKPEEIAALQSQVTSLTTENKTLKDGQTAAIESAKNSARQEATTAENTRRTKIKEIADKYNKDGDLDGLTVTALAGTTTPDQFKDQVLDAVNARAVKPAIRPSGSEKVDTNDKDEAEAKFIKDYAACVDTASRLKLVRSNKALARKLSREGKLSDEGAE